MGGLCERMGVLISFGNDVGNSSPSRTRMQSGKTPVYKKLEGLMQLKIKNKLPVAQ